MAKKQGPPVIDEIPDYREPVVDPSVDTVGGLVMPTDEHDGPIEDIGAPRTVTRPSTIRELMAAANYTGDPYRFIRQEGLPNPQRLYRVSAKGPVGKVDTQLPALDIDAVDESDAQRQYLVKKQIKQADAHRFRFRCVVIEE